MRVRLAVFAFVPLAAGCGGGSPNEAGSIPVTTTIAGVAASNHGFTDVRGAKSVNLDLNDDYFEPTVIRGKSGQRLQAVLENYGAKRHNFTVPSQGIDRDLAPGKKATVKIRIPRSGQVLFYCRFHRQLGMAGGLARK
jgi:plastocyanin